MPSSKTFPSTKFPSGQTRSRESQLSLAVTKAAAIRSPCFFVAVLLLVAAAAVAQAIPEEHLTSTPKSTVAYQPITGRQRFHWFLKSTIGPQGLTAGLFSAGFGTAINRPTEYGPHWSG